MKIQKISNIPKEEAHGGSGSRRLYLSKGQLQNASFEAMTYGYLPADKSFDWHEHAGTEEVMLVLKGEGTVSDKDGEYKYSSGDMFIFPPNTEHKIHNPTSEEHEMIFIRLHI